MGEGTFFRVAQLDEGAVMRGAKRLGTGDGYWRRNLEGDLELTEKEHTVAAIKQAP